MRADAIGDAVDAGLLPKIDREPAGARERLRGRA